MQYTTQFRDIAIEKGRMKLGVLKFHLETIRYVNFNCATNGSMNFNSTPRDM
jgi:hypothetical protein